MLSVNGIEHRLTNPSPSLLLVDFIRSLGHTGTKVACGEGGCGSCTVIATGADGVPRSINACLRLLCACDGLAITTTEGLGSQAEGFAAVQQVIAGGAAGSWALTNLAPRALEGDFAPGFLVRHLLKDIRLARQCAAATGIDLPGLATAERLYELVAAQGWDDLGTQALYRLPFGRAAGDTAARP